MIVVKDLIMSMRYGLGDMQGLNISDYQLIEPINQAVSRLYQRLSEPHSLIIFLQAERKLPVSFALFSSPDI